MIRKIFRIRCFRFVLFVLAAFALLSVPSAQAEQKGRCGENVEWRLNDEGTLTISGTGEMDSYTETGAPWKRSGVRKVIIEPGVTRIGALAFDGCGSLESVEIPETVTEIGKYAFRECTGLRNVLLPEGLRMIGRFAFDCCESLESVLIPASVEIIETDIFCGTDKANLQVTVVEGSYAEEYCRSYHLWIVHPGEAPSGPCAEMPASFTEKYPGCVGRYCLSFSDQASAVYLAAAPDGTLVLLCGIWREESGWTIVRSAPLPSGAKAVMEYERMLLDLGHARCTVGCYYDDVWGIDSVGWRDLFVGPKWMGDYMPFNTQEYGIHPWGDLTCIDWMTVTDDWKEALSLLDTSGYATPNRENRDDPTPIYESADSASPKIADLFNGAPLFITGQSGEWTRVSIGRNDGSSWQLQGWVRTADLQIGKRLNRDQYARITNELSADSGTGIILTVPDGTVELPPVDEMSLVVIGRSVIGGQEYWLVYSFCTDQAGFIPEDRMTAGAG